MRINFLFFEKDILLFAFLSFNIGNNDIKNEIEDTIRITIKIFKYIEMLPDDIIEYSIKTG